MGLGNDDWMSEWTEVNVLPAGALDPERLLTGVAEPLVRSLSADWDRWHYFWEPELRLRFRWRDTADVSACHARVTAHLDEAREHGALTSWTEADYDGEAEGYGPDLWEAVLADWMSGSELALAVIRAGRDKPEPRSWYWARREHLFANELRVPEAYLLLLEADGRLDMWGTIPAARGLRVAGIREALAAYLDDADMGEWEARFHEVMLAMALLAQQAETGAPSVPAGRALMRWLKPARAR